VSTRRAPSLIIAVALSAVTAVLAGAEPGTIRVIELQHRSAAEVAAVLAALAGEAAAVSGMDGKLVLRAEPAELAELERLARRLDTPPQRLLVKVRHRRDDTRRGQGLGLGAGAAPDTAGSRAGATLRVYGSDSNARRDAVFQVQGLSGRPAYVNAGRLVPHAEGERYLHGGGVLVRDGVGLQEVSSGFYVLPRVQGEQVTVAVYPRAARLDPSRPGAIEYSEAQTVVSGALGEWIDLGASEQRGRGGQAGLGASTRRAFTRWEHFQLQVRTLD